MKSPKNNLVCVAGLPGAGKTSVCKVAKNDACASVVEVDDYVCAILEELVLNPVRGNRLRGIFADYAKLCGIPGLGINEEWKKFLDYVNWLPEEDMEGHFDSYKQSCTAFLASYATRKAIKDAIEAALSTDQKVLLPSAHLNAALPRNDLKTALDHFGIVPQILLIRAQFRNLQEVANKRVANQSPVDRLLSGRTDVARAIKIADPLYPAEGWNLLGVVDNDRSRGVEEVFAEVRAKISETYGWRMFSPVDFLDLQL